MKVTCKGREVTAGAATDTHIFSAGQQNCEIVPQLHKEEHRVLRKTNRLYSCVNVSRTLPEGSNSCEYEFLEFEFIFRTDRVI
jgi:hypothetical protein